MLSPQSRFHRAHRLSGSAQKENCPPAAAVAPCSSGLSPPSETPCKAPEQGVWSATTPTKISPGHEGGARANRPAVESMGQKLNCYEVKNTFIHYGSPLKTVSVVTPPKTVPSDFRPEVLLLEQQHPRLRTPAAVLHAAATPSTAGGALAGRDFCGASTTGTHSVFLAQPAAPAAGTHPASMGAAPSSTLLRLSDFLPPPSASTCVTSAAGTHTGVQVLPGVTCTWQQQPTTYVETMPPVPPLPGPPCQAGQCVLQAPMPPPTAPPPQFNAYDSMAGMQVPSTSYDPLQFITGEATPTGASSTMMSATNMHYDHARMPQMPPQLPPQLPPQQPPTLPLDQSTGAFQLSSQCGMSPMNGMSGPSPTNNVFCLGHAMTSTPMNMTTSTPMGGTGPPPACGSVTVEGCLGAFCMGNPAAGMCGSGTLGGAGTGLAPSCSGIANAGGAISISAGHFPEPGSAQGQFGQADVLAHLHGSMGGEAMPPMGW